MKDDTSHVRFATSRTCTETSQSSTKEDTSSARPGFRIYAVSVVLALSVLMVGLVRSRPFSLTHSVPCSLVANGLQLTSSSLTGC
jgi:hypothetical protein